MTAQGFTLSTNPQCKSSPVYARAVHTGLYTGLEKKVGAWRKLESGHFCPLNFSKALTAFLVKFELK